MLALEYLFLGIFLSSALFHFLVSVRQKKDYENRSFAFLLLSFAFTLFYRIILFKSYSNLNHLFLRYIFDIPTLLSIALSIAFFSHTVFDLHKIRSFTKISYILFAFLGLFSITCFLLRSPFINYFYLVFYSASSIYAVIFLSLAGFQIYKNKQYLSLKNKLIIIGLFFVLLDCSLLSIMMFLKIELQAYIAYSPLLLLTLLTGYALISNFVKEHNELFIIKNNLDIKVKEQTKKLYDITEQRTNYMINISHELKTPVTIINMAFDDYIKTLNYTQNKHLLAIKNNLDILKRYICNFFTIEKMHKGVFDFDHSSIIDIKEFIKNKLELFKLNASKKNITITFNSFFDASYYCKIDPYAFDCILNNLISNAIKYNKNNGIIDITLSQKNKNIILSIADTGIGISKIHLEHIFDEYYQVSHKKSNLSGIGIGLSIAKRIIASLNGSISVKSDLSVGTTFKIRLPMHALKKNENPAEFTVSKPIEIYDISLKKCVYDKNKKTVLLVEDNIESLSYLFDSLSEKYNVYYAFNGVEAIKRLNEISPLPDIIISDVMMDIMDGISFKKELSNYSKFNSIPFVFLSANHNENTKLEALKYGAIDYIEKPFSMDELILKINSLIKHTNNKSTVFMQTLHQFMDNKNPISSNVPVEEKSKKYNLSFKEIEVLKLLLSGKQNKEISALLNINSENTIKSRVRSIYKKCGVSNRMELINAFGY